MEIKRNAQAGTFESSDILVLVEQIPKGSGRVIDLSSPVMYEYGNSIKKEINNVLDKFEIKDVKLICKDKGALNITICARVETAISRALNIQEGTI